MRSLPKYTKKIPHIRFSIRWHLSLGAFFVNDFIEGNNHTNWRLWIVLYDHICTFYERVTLLVFVHWIWLSGVRLPAGFIWLYCHEKYTAIQYIMLASKPQILFRRYFKLAFKLTRKSFIFMFLGYSYLYWHLLIEIIFISIFSNHGLARCYLIFIIVSAATIARYCLCSLSVFHMFTFVPTVSLDC